MLIEAKTLQEIMGRLSPVMRRGRAMPVLCHARVRTVGQDVVIEATDVNVWVRDVLPTTGDGAYLLHDKVREIADASPGTLDVSGAESRCTVKGIGLEGNILFKFTLSTDRLENWPVFREIVGDRVTVSRRGLVRSLARTLPHIGRDELRPRLCAVALYLAPEKMVAVATDGRTLGRTVRPEPLVNSEAVGLISTQLAAQIARTWKAEEADLTVCYADSMISFESGGSLICGKLVEGKLANYDDAIAQHTGKIVCSFTADREEMVSAFRRMKAAIGSDASVGMVFDPEAVHLRAASVEDGTNCQDQFPATVTVDCGTVRQCGERGPDAAHTVGVGLAGVALHAGRSGESMADNDR